MLDRALERQRAKNAPIDMTPAHMLKTFLTTGKGWITRKAMEIGTVAGAAAAAYTAGIAEHAHATPDQVAALSTHTGGFVAVAFAILVNLGLSLLADKANKELPPAK